MQERKRFVRQKTIILTCSISITGVLALFLTTLLEMLSVLEKVIGPAKNINIRCMPVRVRNSVLNAKRTAGVTNGWFVLAPKWKNSVREKRWFPMVLELIVYCCYVLLEISRSGKWLLCWWLRLLVNFEVHAAWIFTGQCHCNGICFDVSVMTLCDAWPGAHRRGGCCDVGVMEKYFFPLAPDPNAPFMCAGFYPMRASIYIFVYYIDVFFCAARW